jgi:flagellar brake protein
MFQETQPASLDSSAAADGSDPWGPFRVSNGTEIAALLRQLRDGSVPVNLNAPDGAAMPATLWSIDSAQSRISFSADEGHPALQRFVYADEAVAVAYLDSVKLQFDLLGMLLVRSARACALQCALPRSMLRFQRRTAYRVRTNERHAPTARLRHPAIPDMGLSLRVLDVSIGGCALFLPADVPLIEPGMRLDGVRIELDADTRFTAALQMMHVSSVSAGLGVRLGCEWAQIDGAAQRALQRYIDQTQKRQRLLSLG